MANLLKPIAYLQDSDFDNQGNLINPDISKSIPVVIMIQASFCGHCNTAKPAFQEFANMNDGKVFCATIQGDGKEKGEPELSKRLDMICPDFKGYPSYVGYKNGKRVAVHDGGRDVKSLEEFVNKL